MSAIRAYRTSIESVPGMAVCIILDLGATEFRHYMSCDEAKALAVELGAASDAPKSVVASEVEA
jgi:hypothetical protein